MVKDPEKELEQLKQALKYLADIWESSPLSSEDPETCRQHAMVLRSLLYFHVRFLGADATMSQIQAAIQKARLAGLYPHSKASEEDIEQMREALRRAELTDLFEGIEDFLKSTSGADDLEEPDEGK